MVQKYRKVNIWDLKACPLLRDFFYCVLYLEFPLSEVLLCSCTHYYNYVVEHEALQKTVSSHFIEWVSGHTKQYPAALSLHNSRGVLRGKQRGEVKQCHVILSSETNTQILSHLQESITRKINLSFFKNVSGRAPSVEKSAASTVYFFNAVVSIFEGERSCFGSL